MKLHFAKEFSSYPQGRYESDGKHSGEVFRKLLMEKFQQAQDKRETLEIIMDDVHGLSGSFLDEAFGKFAKQLKEKNGQELSKKDLSFYGNLPHYKIYISKIWERINKHYILDEQKDAA